MQQHMTRCYAYIRVSTAKQGEHGSSLQEQREAIAAYARRNEITIVEWVEERETAAKGGRPEFTRMLMLLRSGRADGVVIHKIDRSARNLRDWADLNDLFDSGIDVHFVHESLDLRSRGGRLSADIQAVIAADFIRNLRDEVRKGINGRLRQGIYPLPAPLGYCNEGGGKPKSIDPETAPLVRAAFELYASGKYTLITLGEELYRRGLRNRRGKRVTKSGLSALLNNPFYVGIIRIRRSGEQYQGIHEPLIPKSLFDRVQRLLSGRTKSTGWKQDFRYRRMFCCAHCGLMLIGERQKCHAYYRCHTPTCPTTSLREEVIDTVIGKTIERLLLPSHLLTLLEEHIRVRQSTSGANREATLRAKQLTVAQLDDRLNRLMDAYIDKMLGQDDYTKRKALLLSERARLCEEIGNLESGDRSLDESVQEKLELLRTLSLKGIPANADERLQLLQTATSNLAFDQNRLVISWVSPFSLIAEREEITYGGPQRDSPRTVESCRIDKCEMEETIASVQVCDLKDDTAAEHSWCEAVWAQITTSRADSGTQAKPPPSRNGLKKPGQFLAMAEGFLIATSISPLLNTLE